jgi:TP901 family phage tail tape measure protein
MAAIGDLFFRLLADGSQLEQDISKQATAAADKAGAAAGMTLGAAMSKGLQSAGKQLQSTGRSLTTSLTLPIVAAGAAIVKTGIDFDTSLRQIVALTDTTAGEIDGIRKGILDLANVVGKDPTELAKGFYFLASAGFDTAQAMDILTQTAKASAAGLGDTADISRVVGAAINSFGKENLTATDAVDQLLRAVKDGTAEAPDFANALGNVLATAGQMGATFADTTAAIAAMTLKGVDADTAATNLNQIFVSLLKTTPASAKALASVGLSAEGLRAELKEKGLLAVLQTLQGAFEGNDTAAAAVFGNVRALRGILALTTGDAAQVAGVFNDVADGTANLGQAFEDTDGPGRQLDQAITEIKTALIDLSTDVMPPVLDVLHSAAGFVHGLVGAFKAMPGPVRTGIVQLAGLAAVLGPALFILGKFSSGIGVGISALSALGRVGAKLGPRLAEGIAGSLKGSQTLSLVSEGLGSLLAKIPGAAIVKGAITKAGALLGAGLGAAVGVGLAAAGGVAIALAFKAIVLDPGLQAQSRAIGKSVDEEISTGVGDLEQSKAALEKGIADISGQAFGLGGTLYGDQVRDLQAKLDAVNAEIERRAAAGVAGVAGALADGQGTVTDAAGQMVDGVAGEVAAAAGEAQAAGRTIPDSIAAGVLEKQNVVVDAMSTLKNLMKNALRPMQRVARDLGRDSMRTLGKALVDGRGAVRTEANRVAEVTAAELNSIIQLGGKAGEKALQKLRDGMHSKNPDVRRAAEAVYKIVKSELDRTTVPAGRAGTSAGESFADHLRRAVAAGDFHVNAQVGFTIPGHAGGGREQKGVPRIVGEKGPELFIPDVSGRTLSHADTILAASHGRELGGADGGDTFNINMALTGVLRAETPGDVARRLQQAASSGVITSRRQRMTMRVPSDG